MPGKIPPKPERFEVYKLLSDGSGFTINGCRVIFKFDRFGGWFDQFGNYYNSDGKPESPPSDSEDYHSEGSRSQHSPVDEEEDQFEKEFGGPNNYVEEEDQPEDIHFTKIAKNISTLNSYPAGKPFRVNFKNMPYFSKRIEVFNYFKSKVAGILNVIFLENEKKQFNGNGYFVLEGVKAGQSLLKLQGEKYNGRDVSFYLDDAEEFLLEPILDEELYPDFQNKKPLKNFITKGNAPKVEQKPEPTKPQLQKQEPKEVKPKQVQQKQEPKEVKPKPQVQKQEPKEVKKPQPKIETPVKVQPKKVENQQQFATYIFERKPFPKKSSFKEWLEQHHFSHTDDIQQVNKIEGDETKAKVTMKRKVFNALNGKKCNQQTVKFAPV